MKTILLTAALIGLVAATTPKIGGRLSSTLQSKSSVNVIISFVGSNQAAVSSIESRSFQSRTERLNTLKSSLQTLAQTTQRNVVQLLTKQSVQFKSFWVSNQIFIRGADSKLIEAISKLPEVELIEESAIIPLIHPVEKKPATSSPVPHAEWGITKIQAEAAWQITNGSGVVVGSIDTGVRATHEALRDSYVGGDYGWLDPINKYSAPRDNDEHGTHTMGTIVGSNGIGVAPGAKWMSCVGCAGWGCPEEALLECGEWILCPYKTDGSDPDCSKAPVVSSNSWGGSGGRDYYQAVTEAWIAGGVIPVFSNGNSGPSCGTAGSPGDGRRVIGVGATTDMDAIARFSSVGPSAWGQIKPEISAPGQDVRSSIPGSDTSYGVFSGTSMACPHVSGVVALLKSLDENMSFGQVRQALIDGVDTATLQSKNETCGNLADTKYPNMHFGFGRLNALKAVQAGQALLKQ